MRTRPTVANSIIPPSLILEWYQRIRSEGFNELETFDQFMEPIPNEPLKDTWRQNTEAVIRKLAANEPQYWYAAQRFLHDWPGWGSKKEKKKPFLRRMWELYLDGNYTYETIARMLTYEGVKEGTGYRMCSKTVERHIKRLNVELKEWLRLLAWESLCNESTTT